MEKIKVYFFRLYSSKFPFQHVQQHKNSYSLNVLFPRDHDRFKVPRIGVPHGTFPTGCAPLKYRLLIMGRTADRHALQFLHHLWICYLNTYKANRLRTRLSETQSLIAIFLFALYGRLHVDCKESLFIFRFSEGSAHARASSLSLLAPSVMWVVIYVSHEFRSTDKENRDCS